MRKYRIFTPSLFEDVAVEKFGLPFEQLDVIDTHNVFDDVYRVVESPVFRHLVRIAMFRNKEAQRFWKEEILDVMCHAYEPRYPDDWADDYRKRQRQDFSIPQLRIIQDYDGSLCCTEYPLWAHAFVEVIYNMGFDDIKDFDVDTIMKWCQGSLQFFYDDLRIISFVQYESLLDKLLEEFIRACNYWGERERIPNYADRIVDAQGHVNTGLTMQHICQDEIKVRFFTCRNDFDEIPQLLFKLCVFPTGDKVPQWKKALVDSLLSLLDLKLQYDTAKQDIKWHYFYKYLITYNLGCNYEEYNSLYTYFDVALMREVYDSDSYNITALMEAYKSRIIGFYKKMETLRNIPPSEYRNVVQRAVDDFVNNE